MELFVIILLVISVISISFYLWFEMSIINDRIQFLSDKINQLERSAVKVTYNEPYSPQDEKRVIKPITEGRVKSQIKTYEGEIPMTQAPPPPKPLRNKRKKKTVEDWEEEIDLGGHE